MSDPLTDLVTDVQHNGLRWVTVITLYSLYRKERRNHKLNLRDEAIFHNLRILMEDRGLGDQWKDGPKHGLPPVDLPNLKQLFIILWRATRTPKSYYPKGMTKMKAYLNKLGSRKFQAFLLVTVCNAVLFIGSLTGNIHINDQLNQWVPLINLLVQTITTIIYQLIQGSVDKEAQKQQVYVVPTVDPAPPVDVTEFEAQVEAVNAELNRCLTLIKTHDYADAPKEAIQLYTTIHALIKGNA